MRGAKHSRPFAPWRIVVWLMMLLAAAGFVIYAFAAVVSAGAIGSMSAEAVAAGGPDPRIQLAWSLVYATATFIVMAVTLGTLRWREWGRRAIRLVALLLVFWFAWTAWVEFRQWQEVGVVLGQAGLPPDALAEWTRRRNILLVGAVLKVASIPVMGWLAWALGSVRIRQQFAPAL